MSRWGQKFGQGPGSRSGQPHRRLAHRRGGKSLLCWSVGALLEVIFESTLPFFFPSHLEAQQFHFNHIKEKQKASDWLKEGWEGEVYCTALVTAPNLYTHDSVSVFFFPTHMHLCVLSTDANDTASQAARDNSEEGLCRGLGQGGESGCPANRGLYIEADFTREHDETSFDNWVCVCARVCVSMH